MTGTFMAAEIAETGRALRRQLDANREATARLAAELRAGEPAFVATIARGSSDHAALFLKHVVELKLGLACASLAPSIASLYRAPLRLSNARSRSPSRNRAEAPTSSPCSARRRRRARRRSRSSTTRIRPAAADADALLPLLAGEERSVAATKSMIASLVAGAVARRALERRRRSRRRARRGCRRSSTRSRAAPPDERWRDARRRELAVRHRPRRDLRGRDGGGAEAQGDVGDPCRGVLLGRGAAWAGGRRHAGFSGARLRPAPADAARDGFFETVDRLASFGAAPLIVDVERHARWPTLVAPDAGHAMVTPIAALHAFYWLAEATARRRGRNPDEPPHLMKVTRTV